MWSRTLKSICGWVHCWRLFTSCGMSRASVADRDTAAPSEISLAEVSDTPIFGLPGPLIQQELTFVVLSCPVTMWLAEVRFCRGRMF